MNELPTRHCEMEQEGETHDLAPGVVCVACWNQASQPPGEVTRLQKLLLEQTKLNTRMWQDGYDAAKREAVPPAADMLLKSIKCAERYLRKHETGNAQVELQAVIRLAETKTGCTKDNSCQFQSNTELMCDYCRTKFFGAPAEKPAIRGCIHGSDPITECQVCYPEKPVSQCQLDGCTDTRTIGGRYCIEHEAAAAPGETTTKGS